MKTRIVEEIDSDGKSIFIPQRKINFFGIWVKFLAFRAGYVKFYDFEECKKWLQYDKCTKIKIHQV